MTLDVTQDEELAAVVAAAASEENKFVPQAEEGRPVIVDTTPLKYELEPELQARMKEWIDSNVSSNMIPSGEIIVSRNGVVVCEYKNVNLAKPILRRRSSISIPDFEKQEKKEQIYRQYSLTKPVITICALMLYEEGLLDLDAPVAQYLGDGWKMENMRVMDRAACEKLPAGAEPITVPCRVPMTVRHLLMHTSGLSHGLGITPNVLDLYYKKKGISTDVTLELNPYYRFGHPSLQHFLDILVTCPLLFQPGEGWEYSYSLELVTKIIEEIGKPMGFTDTNQVVQDRICKRLDMQNTCFFLTKEQYDRLSPIYYEKPGLGLVNVPAIFPKYVSGSAGLVSTLRDYFKLVSMLARGGLGLNGCRVLKEETVQMMRENRLLDAQGQPCSLGHFAKKIPIIEKPEDYGFGLGGRVCLMDDKAIATRANEFSWSGAGQTHFWIDPTSGDELVVVFMTALVIGARLKTSRELHGLVYNVVLPPLKVDKPKSSGGCCVLA